MEQFFGNRKITLYASGTAALAQAIARCAERRAFSSPEVIIPAYGCPDLVEACVCASVNPRLVDVLPRQWGYEPASLRAAVSPNTAAVVAVNLLGIGDDVAHIAPICNEWQIPIIQDSAQHLPRDEIPWPGDYVVLSFGRGKPLNLLRGGVLISPPGTPTYSPGNLSHYTSRERLLTSRAAAIAFNVVTRPHIYRLVSALPWTGLGRVTYKSLDRPDPLPDNYWTQIGTAFELYRSRQSYQRGIWTPALEEWAKIGITSLQCPGTPVPMEPLRLALMAPDRATRDILVDAFNRAGLGASRLYGAVLPRIPGAPKTVQTQGPFPNAELLADILFTLPTHSLVNDETVSAAHEIALSWKRTA